MNLVSLNHIQVGNAGPSLLFLHGLNESLDGYQPVMKELGSGLRMYAIDLRGHGDSPWQKPYDLGAFVHDVVEHIREEIGSPVILSGHSVGGLISAGIAAKHPGLVEAAILEEPLSIPHSFLFLSIPRCMSSLPPSVGYC